jgi:hypothetical protein
VKFSLKSFISFLLIFCCASVSLGADNSIPTNSFPTNKKVEMQIEKEKTANYSYEQMVQEFGLSSNSDFHFPNYPNEYGGAYYRDEKLCVCLTNTNENIQLYFSSLVDHPEILEFVPVKHSYNELYDTSILIAKNMPDGLSSISIDIINNTIDIGVPYKLGSEQYEIIESRISEILGVANDINIEYSEEQQASISVELKGGQKICWGSSSFGTLTICGTWQGNAAILTAGHCVTVGSTYKHLTSSGSTLGTGSFRKYDSEQFYDYGVVTLPSGYSSTFTPTNKVLNSVNYTTITSTLTSSSGLVGTTVCKYGAKKGFGVATINNVDSIVYYSDGTKLYGMTKATFTSGAGYKGDSGGPIYSGHKLYGIYSGDNANTSTLTDATYFWYSPIYGASGFTVKTS